MNSAQKEYFKLVNLPVKFRLFLFHKLPAAFFSGIKVVEMREEKCVTSVPFKWFTQNPFKSAYFASLAMAAEMSTGLLSQSNTYKRTPPASMLVTNMEAVYSKKATDITFFTCDQGAEIAETVDKAYETRKGETIRVKSVGKNKNGELIAEFWFTWSFKVKQKV